MNLTFVRRTEGLDSTLTNIRCEDVRMCSDKIQAKIGSIYATIAVRAFDESMCIGWSLSDSQIRDDVYDCLEIDE